MNAWNTNKDLISRDEAEGKIAEMAKAKGIRGSFKVFYDNKLVVDPTDLPEQVDMKLVKVSATLDQA